MALKVIVGLFTFIAVFAAFWASAAFVRWDIAWMNDIDRWSGGDRLSWLYMMIILPACAGALAFSLKTRP